MLFLFVLFQGFGLWFLYDAMIVYPARGQAFADYQELVYLRHAQEQGRLDPRVSVESPEARFEELKDRKLQNPELMSALQTHQLNWLEALDIVAALDTEHTVISDPSARLSELETRFGTSNNPKPLSYFDIPSQWLFFVLCTVVALAVLFVFLRAARVSYRWDPSEKRLTLPGGATLVPSDLEDIDKTKWHKFFVVLQVGPDHGKLSNAHLKLDLLRYQPLEQWILEMERERFPERAEEEAGQDAPSDRPPTEGAEDETRDV